MATEETQLRAPNVQETLNNLGQNRRMVLVGAGVVTVVITLLIVMFAWSKGTSKGAEIELVKKIDQDRAFEIISKLKSNDLDGKITDSDLPGKVNVTVFQKDFDRAALTLAKSDLLQEDGFNLFDKSDWAASDYDKRIKMMRAVNGDISRIVSRMSGIKWATVRVNIPEPQLFSQYQAQTTATVQVETLDDSKLARSQVRSIINLLVGYVPNLQKNNISIIDTNGITYSAVESDEVAASELIEESERVNKLVQKRLEEYLVPLIGTNNFIVRVSSEISRKKIEESATTFAEGVVGQEQVGDERLGGGAQAPAVGPAVSADGKSYVRSNRVTQNYPSFKQKTVSTPPGRISKISVAVAIDREILPRISMKQLRESIAAITSPNTTIDDVKITVADFATEKAGRTAYNTSKGFAFPQIGSISQLLESIKNMPRWASIAIAIFGVFILFSTLSKPRMSSEQSTIAQINQARQRQQYFPQEQYQPQQQIAAGPAAQIPAQFQQIPEQVAPQQPQEDLTGLISDLKATAQEKPDFLANKLQIWLEEGSPAQRS